MKYHSLLSFAPLPVTVITTIVYLSILIPLIIIHETVPPIPKDPEVYSGFNLTEAWYDLDELSNGYHPFNSRRNDEVRGWLLSRIKKILVASNVDWDFVSKSKEVISNYSMARSTTEDMIVENRGNFSKNMQSEVVVFDDLVSNYTNTELTNIETNGRKTEISTYFEGSNIIVYIRGTKDKKGDWWRPLPSYAKHQHASGGVMVNAHFDSVSTGYGATDDGVGVVTGLQLIKHFITEGNKPERGIVVLFNNNEEDGLYGSKAFMCHEMASFVYTFLNLEGAGAGGRATLFRSTDLEVTRAYSRSPHPFGTVVSADGFSLKFIRSETDYVVFRERGYRGLDVAFWEPRSRYHTDQDDAKHTSKASLWHMLSTSVEILKYLTTDKNFYADIMRDDTNGKNKDIKKTDAVWFDLFGQFFAIFGLRTLFAWSLTLLIATPLILLVISYLLIHQDKYYLFTGAIKSKKSKNESVSLKGWHGAFRFPLALIFSSALTSGSAFLLKKFNPLIIYSSKYSVWSMFLSLFFCSFWILMASFDKIRPSALNRAYVLIWMFSIGWFLLIAVTVYEDRFQISSGYLFVLNQGTVFLATFIGLCELFALPKKSSVVESSPNENETRDVTLTVSNPDTFVGTRQEEYHDQEEEPQISETTPLIGGNTHQNLIGATFSRGYRRSNSEQLESFYSKKFGNLSHSSEQKWSTDLPSWTWLLQFLILAPFPLIINGQVGLLLVSATSQTSSDGSSLIVPYLISVICSILIVLPLSPFVHRIKYHVPLFLFFVFIGTLIYNLSSFPFSNQNRYKVFFQQTVDLNSGFNRVTLVGIEKYVRDIISYIPSAANQPIICSSNSRTRSGLSSCSYEGIAPNVMKNFQHEGLLKREFENWLTFNVTRYHDQNKATFKILGHETKACVIQFDLPFSAFYVHDAASQRGHWSDIPETGSDQIKLWHRDWDRKWIVDVEWSVNEGKKPGDEGRTGKVICLWSDHNEPGTIPALDEIKRFMPVWSTAVKLTDGLVEGSKTFAV